jgi:hypothetical protein
LDAHGHSQPATGRDPASLPPAGLISRLLLVSWRFERIFTGLISGLILLVCAVVYIPFLPYFPVDKLDSSWQLAVNAAVAKRLVFGKDIFFTMGPYAAVFFRQYHPATSAMMFGGSALMAAACGFLLLCLCEGYGRLIALALALILLLVPVDTQLFALPLLALMLIYRVALPNASAVPIAMSPVTRFTFVLAFLALGVLLLVKGTFGFCSDIVGFFAFVLLLSRRKFLLAFCFVVLAAGWLAVLWVAAAQPIQFLPNFFMAQLPVVSGYTDAMALSGPAWQLWVFLVSSLAVWIFGNLRLQKDGDAGVVLALGSAMILFLAFKEGFVRADHAAAAGGMLGVSGIAFALLKKTPMAALGCLAGLIGFSTINAIPVGFAPIAGPIAAAFEADAASIHSRINDPDFFKRIYDTSLATIRAAQVLPQISGTADVYPVDQSILLASGLNWDPRPTLQSYTAYTPGLAAADARHLIGPSAPANILFQVQPIDNRLPALDDGASWPALLADYRFSGLYGDFALLRRQAQPAPVLISPLVSASYQTGAKVALPSNAPFIWAELSIQPTLLGKVLGIIFKPPQLQIEYYFAGAPPVQFRYVAGMGQTGFLLSPLVQSTRDFMALSLSGARDYASPEVPIAIRLMPQYGGSWFWQGNFSLRLSAITFPVQSSTGQYLFKVFEPATPSSVPEPVTTACSIDGINNRLIKHLPVEVDGFLHVTGWAAISFGAGMPTTKTTITVIDADGGRKSAVASQVIRTDVARVFKQPDLKYSGFDLRTELTAPPGDYLLTVHPSSGNRNWVCLQQVAIRILQPHITSGSQINQR